MSLPTRYEFKVIRYNATPTETIGAIFCNGYFKCYSCEDRLRAPGVKVPGYTAIPEGKYALDFTMSNRFKKMMPLVVNVPMFEGIRIHAGNTAVDTEGCLIPGLSLSPDMTGVVTSKVACDNLYAIIENGKTNNIPMTIEYVNACKIPA